MPSISVGELACLRPGRDTVVTSTRRLARRLHLSYDRIQERTGRLAWPDLDVLSWGAWADRCWCRLRDSEGRAPLPGLLPEAQEEVLWEQVTAGAADELGRLLLPAEIAREARRAWSLVAEYRIPIEDLRRGGGSETRQLLWMATQVETRLRDEGWRTRGQRLHELTTDISLRHIGPGRLLLAGFDELTPAQHTLVAAFQSAGTEVLELEAPRIDSAGSARPCADPGVELQQAALAARGWLEGRPDARIGIVLADLEQRRQEVEETFDDILVPERLLPGRLSARRPWSVSLGERLAAWPPVDAALRFLGLSLRAGSFADVGLLLRSPFLGGGDGERDARGRLDAWLRDRGMQQIDLIDFPGCLGRSSDPSLPACPDLLRRLSRLEERVAAMPDRADPARWALLFGEALKTLGWPGDRALDSAEYQCLMKWQQTLSQFAGMGPVTGRLTGPRALDRLRRLAADTTFQPETPEAPVQVLGLLETPGLAFDALWVTGMHHQAWPRPLRPNSLIPTSIQRSHRIPRSCPEVELAFAERRTSALSRCAGDVIFSWPTRIEDESFRVSPLLSSLPAASGEPQVWIPPAVSSAGGVTVESLADYRLSPWPPGSKARGGSAVLGQQSACPFQAQARARLGARSLERPRPGVSPMDSGTIAHLTLEWLWQDWGDSATLADLDDAELAARVTATAQRACRRVLQGESPFDASVRELESRRIAARLLALLDQDRARAAFVVEATECRVEAEFEGLLFRLRIDRIDRCPDGTRLLVDYKTGRVNPRDWHGERPKDPQLPFYALVADASGPIGGIAYGALRTGEEGYSGYAGTDLEGTGIKGIGSLRQTPDDAETWEETLSVWSRHLGRLARDFAAGEAGVRPRRVAEDCRYCDLSPLCRRHELAAMGALPDA